MANGRKRFSQLKKSPKNRLLKALRTLTIYILIALAALIFFVNLSGGPSSGEVPISQVLTDIRDNKVDKIVVEGDRLTASLKDNKEEIARKESTDSIYQILKNADIDPKSVTIEVKDISMQQAWLGILGTVLPIAAMAIFLFLIFRQAREGAQGIFSFGQSKAKVFNKDAPGVKFSDIAGVDEAKRELEEVVEFLKKNLEEYIKKYS